jgi:DNA helicase HerA-like ATPase
MPSSVAGPLAIPLGVAIDTQRPVSVDLEFLRKHTAIFAGSGSGKTVLIRRLIEECALHGVSAIVLDPNNDLARLGDRWPEPPKYWSAGDGFRMPALHRSLLSAETGPAFENLQGCVGLAAAER